EVADGGRRPTLSASIHVEMNLHPERQDHTGHSSRLQLPLPPGRIEQLAHRRFEEREAALHVDDALEQHGMGGIDAILILTAPADFGTDAVVVHVWRGGPD